MCEPVFLPNSSGNFSVGSTGAAAQPGIENPSLTWGNSSHMPMTENSINAFAITKILKPIGFSASVFDNVQDVLITFRALRYVILLQLQDLSRVKFNDIFFFLCFCWWN
jgi:hypothetical protein